MIETGVPSEAALDYFGCGYWSEDGGDWKMDGIAISALEEDLDANTAVIECTTYHLSAFARKEISTTSQWDTSDLFTDFFSLRQTVSCRGYRLIPFRSIHLQCVKGIMCVAKMLLFCR